MNRLVAAICGLLACVPGFAAAAPSETFDFGRFGEVSVYRPSGEPKDVVLFVSGDGGWSLGVLAMAERLAAKDTVVAGIDIRHYLAQLEKSTEKCVSPDVDFENLSHYLQSKLGLKQYLQPTLVGYSSGAALVYATLAESPDGLFKGALSLGFCSGLDLSKPLCAASGLETPRLASKGVPPGANLLPAKKLPGKWIALQGQLDQVCAAPAAQAFAAKVPGSEIVVLPKVGHDSVAKNWEPQFDAAYQRIVIMPAAAAAAGAAGLPASVADLPLTVVPAAAGRDSPWFGIFLTGDGGWVGLDRGVSEALAQQGIPIVGWDSLKYFWSPRTPQGAANDLDRVLRHYASEWHKSHILLIGYSQGADTMPFMVNRLPAATREMVGYTVLLGLSDRASFEFHVANWLGNFAGGMPTAPEMKNWNGSPYLCLYGEEDGDASCDALTGREGIAVKMPGGHHFGGSYAAMAAQILARLPKP
jgi:type IV secretory pathway VirJ component